MKIYNRTEFMKLPEGTIFTSGHDYCFTDLMIKGETWEVDFLESSLISIEYENSHYSNSMFDLMGKEGASEPINTSFGREGLFDDTILYMVYEKADLEYIISKCVMAIRAIDHPGKEVTE